jgi:hypothetical protein
MALRCFTIGANRYAFSDRAFAMRCMRQLGSRNISSVAGGQTTISNMAFNAAGWLTMKKLLAELVMGSIAFPADLTSDGVNLAPGVTEDLIGSRDVSSSIT